MENLKIELNFCCIQLNSSFTSQINRELWSFWHQDLVAHQIWMKITLWISQNGIVSRMGCIYHERVKSRIHSCDNHLDIHRKRDKNWKWLVKYVYRLFYLDIFVYICVLVCTVYVHMKIVSTESINRNLIHSRTYPVNLMCCVNS